MLPEENETLEDLPWVDDRRLTHVNMMGRPPKHLRKAIIQGAEQINRPKQPEGVSVLTLDMLREARAAMMTGKL